MRPVLDLTREEKEILIEGFWVTKKELSNMMFEDEWLDKFLKENESAWMRVYGDVDEWLEETEDDDIDVWVGLGSDSDSEHEYNISCPDWDSIEFDQDFVDTLRKEVLLRGEK